MSNHLLLGAADHGWGNVMLLAGAGVRQDFHGIGPDADLEVTRDYRDVLTEVVRSRFKARNTSLVFPGFGATPVGSMNEL